MLRRPESIMFGLSRVAFRVLMILTDFAIGRSFRFLRFAGLFACRGKTKPLGQRGSAREQPYVPRDME
jgi:hypothetical protein